MVKWQIVWIKIIDEVDMLHAKIYYNLLPLIGNNRRDGEGVLLPPVR
jgi:hypothetical protein